MGYSRKHPYHPHRGNWKLIKGIRQYIFLLFHFKEFLKLYVNLFYRFCVTLLFFEIFELKKSQISELSAILDFGGYACDIISRVTQKFYPKSNWLL
jgi:hypothetical protein